MSGKSDFSCNFCLILDSLLLLYQSFSLTLQCSSFSLLSTVTMMRYHHSRYSGLSCPSFELIFFLHLLSVSNTSAVLFLPRPQQRDHIMSGKEDFSCNFCLILCCFFTRAFHLQYTRSFTFHMDWMRKEKMEETTINVIWCYSSDHESRMGAATGTNRRRRQKEIVPIKHHTFNL